MKRFLSLILVLALVLSVSSFTYASTDNQFSTSISEQDIILKLDEGSIPNTYGIVRTAGNTYKDMYINELEKRSEFSEDTLKNYGYSSDQIGLLRNFEATEYQLRALSSSLNISGRIKNWDYSSSSNRTSATIKFNWSWSSKPSMTKKDIVALAWSDGFKSTSSTSKMKVYYYSPTGNKKSYSMTGKKSTGEGISYSFNMDKWLYDSDMDDYVSWWAKKGSGKANILQSGKIDLFEAVAVYGHSTYSLSPSIDYKGGISVGFSKGVKEMDRDEMEYN